MQLLQAPLRLAAVLPFRPMYHLAGQPDVHQQQEVQQLDGQMPAGNLRNRHVKTCAHVNISNGRELDSTRSWYEVYGLTDGSAHP